MLVNPVYMSKNLFRSFNIKDIKKIGCFIKYDIKFTRYFLIDVYVYKILITVWIKFLFLHKIYEDIFDVFYFQRSIIKIIQNKQLKKK